MATSPDYTPLIEKAITWAASKVGSKDYPFRCLAFVEEAYEKPNQIEVFGCDCAAEAAAALGAQDPGRIPPRGAFVFYDCWGLLGGVYKNWGHVGISLGNGSVIHAWDTVRKDGYLDIQMLSPASGWSSPIYTGWAPVERILHGMVPHTWEG